MISFVFYLGVDLVLVGMILCFYFVDWYSLEYLLEIGVYMLNQVYEGIYVVVYQISVCYLWVVLEFDVVGLILEYWYGFVVFFVGELWIKLGLWLEDSQMFKVNDMVLVIGCIEQILVVEDVWVGEDGYLDIEVVGIVVVSGLDGYYCVMWLVWLFYVKL